jgi:1-acyl-sn-glycerol-3-phosphate acyltransferase
MDDPDDAGQTVELAVGDLYGHLSLGADTDLRDQLPGLESERRVDDWGRSERIEGLVDRTLYGFLYHYWFRVEVEGIENVPADAGALLLANRAGNVLADGAMIAKAVRDMHPAARHIHVTDGARVKRVPGLGMLATKVGVVADHPANVHRLLFDEGQLVLAFPERGGVARPFRRRYQLREFVSDRVAVAARAGVPIIPVAVLGGEEAAPLSSALRRLPLDLAPPLPAKFKLRFLNAVAPDGGVEGLAQAVRALIQEELFEMVGARRSVWLG